MRNMIFTDVREERRVRPVGNDVAPGTALISGGKPAVTITGSGDFAGNAVTLTSGGETLTLAGGRGGVGLADDHATVTFTGTYAFDVAGADVDTEPGTPVTLEEDGTLAIGGAGEEYGVVEFYRGELSDTDTAVTIGA